jgi:hypothetical protein
MSSFASCRFGAGKGDILFRKLPTHHDALAAASTTSPGDRPGTMCYAIGTNNQPVCLLATAEVDSTGDSASPAVSGDGFGDFSPSWFATEAEAPPASPVKGAPSARVNPAVFTMPLSLGQPVSEVVNSASETPRVDDTELEAYAPNAFAFDAETLAATQARETPRVFTAPAASVFPITPSASDADFVASSARSNPSQRTRCAPRRPRTSRRSQPRRVSGETTDADAVVFPWNQETTRFLTSQTRTFRTTSGGWTTRNLDPRGCLTEHKKICSTEPAPR